MALIFHIFVVSLLVVLNNWSEEIMHHIQITITRLYVEKKTCLPKKSSKKASGDIFQKICSSVAKKVLFYNFKFLFCNFLHNVSKNSKHKNDSVIKLALKVSKKEISKVKNLAFCMQKKIITKNVE